MPYSHESCREKKQESKALGDVTLDAVLVRAGSKNVGNLKSNPNPKAFFFFLVLRVFLYVH
jgi:hypothetical protein